MFPPWIKLTATTELVYCWKWRTYTSTAVFICQGIFSLCFFQSNYNKKHIWMQMNMGSSFTLRHKLEYTNNACTAVRTTFHSSHMIYAWEFVFQNERKLHSLFLLMVLRFQVRCHFMFHHCCFVFRIEILCFTSVALFLGLIFYVSPVLLCF